MSVETAILMGFGDVPAYVVTMGWGPYSSAPASSQGLVQATLTSPTTVTVTVT